MKKVVFAVSVLLLVSVACARALPTPTLVVTETPAEDTASRLARLGGVPCPDSDFTCVTLTVPLDHFNPQDSRTIKVVFGVLPATGERKGMFITATGGPGSAGLQSADSYTGAFDPSIPEHFDIVFFDQRGVGQSGGLTCPDAAAVYYRTEADASTPDGEAALVKSTKTFTEDCVREMGNPDILRYLGTDQAVEDLESFRQAMGDDRLWLYGESYGTQYAQTYAAAHGDHLAGLMLDGTVDLTLSGPDFLKGQAQAFADTLQLTLDACNADDICAESMGGGDAVRAYGKLESKLKQSAQEFNFPLAAGGFDKRTFSFSGLEYAASSYMYSEAARMMFLRALAAYSRSEDLVPMARILYDSLSVDPETLKPIPDPSWSDAIYYAVECQDYSYYSGTPDERAEAYLRAGDAVDASMPRMSAIFYGDFPCVFWPNAKQEDTRPAPLQAAGIPTLVLNGTADPATPYSNAQNVFAHLVDGYLITENGGPHVIFGWGVTCVDEVVTYFLVTDFMPERQVICDGVVADAFVPLMPLNAGQFTGPLEAMRAVDDEIYYMPQYYYWDGDTPQSFGCPFGGSFSFEPSDAGETFKFENCAFADDFILNGSGLNDHDKNLLTFDVTVSGLKEGTLSYTRDADDVAHVTGMYDGQAVDLSK